MKKILVLLLTLTLLLSLVSCNNESNDNEGDSTSENTEVVMDKCFTEPIDMTDLPENFSFKYSYGGVDDDKTNTTVVRTAEGVYINSDGSGETVYLKNSDGKYEVYEKNEEGKYEKSDSEDALFGDDDLLTGVTSITYLASYIEHFSLLTDSGKETVAGRECTKYVGKYEVSGMSIDAEYCVDDLTGLCIKYIITGEIFMNGGLKYECTEFSTGGAKLPSVA